MSKNPGRAREGRSPLEFQSYPAAYTPAEVLFANPLAKSSRFATERLILGHSPLLAIFAAGNPISQSKNRFLAGDLRYHDVGVVVVGDRDHRVGALDLRAAQHGDVRRVTHQRESTVGRIQLAEGALVPIHNHHAALRIRDCVGQTRAQPSTAHDHRILFISVHKLTSGRRGRRRVRRFQSCTSVHWFPADSPLRRMPDAAWQS